MVAPLPRSARGSGRAPAPTTDRVRESLFNILGSGRFDDPITDARVLDLFAGTGASGLRRCRAVQITCAVLKWAANPSASCEKILKFAV